MVDKTYTMGWLEHKYHTINLLWPYFTRSQTINLFFRQALTAVTVCRHISLWRLRQIELACTLSLRMDLNKHKNTKENLNTVCMIKV